MANNRAGGIIIFGIEDATRAIVGIRNPSLTHDVVLRAARMIKPAVPLGETSVQTWTIDGCTLLTVEIPPNSGRRYQYDGACYVRRGTHTVPLSVKEISAYLNACGMVAGMTVCDGSHSVEYLLPWRHANPARESRHKWRDSLAGL